MSLFTIQTFSQGNLKGPDYKKLNLADLVEKVSGSVAFVSTEGGTGSGFYINSDGYVVTALHVVKLPDGSIAKKITIQVKSAALVIGGNIIKNISAGVIASVLAEDAEHDIALLKPSSDPFKTHGVVVNGKDMDPPRHPATLCSKAFLLRSGESIFTIGHPFGDFRRITTAGVIASSEPIEIDSDRRLKGTYLVDMLMNHGNSGGPVFTDSGCVIGIADAIGLAPIETIAIPDSLGQSASPITGADARSVQRIAAYNSGLGVIVPHQYVINLLSRAGVQPFDGNL